MGLNWEIGIDIYKLLCIKWASLVAQTVKNLPAVQKIWVRSLGREEPLEKGMTSTPLFLPEEFHGQRTWEATVHTQGHKESDTTE